MSSPFTHVDASASMTFIVGSAAYATVTVTGYAGIVNLPSATATVVSASSVFVTVIVGSAAR